jgi:hypothetical protein
MHPSILTGAYMNNNQDMVRLLKTLPDQAVKEIVLESLQAVNVTLPEAFASNRELLIRIVECMAEAGDEGMDEVTLNALIAEIDGQPDIVIVERQL